MWKVQLFKLNYDEKEIEAVNRVLDSRWLTMGENTKKFEQEFSIFFDGAHSVAVSSGTAALHIALLILGVGTGDEVIVPALTFVADINVIEMVGANPVLADCVSLDDWSINPADIEKLITNKTKAIIVVHYAGFPCDMDPIVKLCNEHSIPLIEDVAHAPGAEYKGKKCGTIGDIGCFSFFTNKNISVGEGGMIISKNKSLYQNALYLRSHGMTTMTLDRHQGRAITYDVIRPGLNYRIDEIRAAIGLVQLEKLSTANKKRELLTHRYWELLDGIEEIRLPYKNRKIEATSAYHIMPVLLSDKVDRISVVNGLKEKEVQSSIHYPAFNEFSAYRGKNLNHMPIANYISANELTLPLYPTMELNEVDYVVNSLKAVLYKSKKV